MDLDPSSPAPPARPARGQAALHLVVRVVLVLSGLALWAWLLALPGCGSASRPGPLPDKAPSVPDQVPEALEGRGGVPGRSVPDLEGGAALAARADDPVVLVDGPRRAPLTPFLTSTSAMDRTWPDSDAAEYFVGRAALEILRNCPDLLPFDARRNPPRLEALERDGRERLIVHYRQELSIARGALRVARLGRLDFEYDDDRLQRIRHSPEPRRSASAYEPTRQ